MVSRQEEDQAAYEIANLTDIVDIKGWKALGNQLVPTPGQDPASERLPPGQRKYHPGDTIEFDVIGKQGDLFGEEE